MPNKAKLSLIVVLLASAGAALLAQSGGDGPRDGNSRNLAGRPAAGDRPALAISEQEETAFLRALAEKRPEQANALIKLKNENPREYRVRLTEAYRTYQSWKDMPPEIQKAHEDQVAAKVEAWRTSRELLNATDPAAKERIRTRLQEILGREFDADQTIREHRLSQLEDQIRRLRAELKDRSERRGQVIEQWLQDLLATKFRPRPDGEPPRRGGAEGRPLRTSMPASRPAE